MERNIIIASSNRLEMVDKFEILWTSKKSQRRGFLYNVAFWAFGFRSKFFKIRWFEGQFRTVNRYQWKQIRNPGEIYVRDTWNVVAVTPCRRVEATSRHRCGSPSSSRFQSVVLLATNSASMDAPSGAVLFSFSGSLLSCSWFSFLVSSVRAVYISGFSKKLLFTARFQSFVYHTLVSKYHSRRFLTNVLCITSSVSQSTFIQ